MKYDFLELGLAIGIILLISINNFFSLLYSIIIIWEIAKNYKMDEMERSLRQKASEIAFYSTILITIIFMTIKNIKITKDIFYFYILFPLIIRNILYSGEIFDKKTSIKISGYTLAGILSLFTLLGNGFSVSFIIEMSIPLTIALITYISLKKAEFGIISFLFLFILFSYFIFRNGLHNPGQFIVYFLLAPILIFLIYQNLRRLKK
jgi:hypothetical protein